ncbi:MAG: hypothetical protein IKA65_05240 [Lentisphaeria bacterium]|nr:hypothetical protein [Lentisphaeria bacterium]
MLLFANSNKPGHGHAAVSGWMPQRRSIVRQPPVDAACGKVVFCAEYGWGVYFCTRPNRRRSKARDCPRCATEYCKQKKVR